MSTPAATKKRVTLDDRTFIVHRDAQGYPLRVYERVTLHKGRPWERLGNVGRWVATSHSTPKSGIIFRALEATA